VTAFKTYIPCPYLFQLRTDPRLRLEAADERAVELDARGFGVLVHAAVERWGREELDAGTPTTDATVIERALVHHLERYASERFPPGRIASVDVQIALARRRLERFARLQAEQAAEGWRLHAVETSFEVEPGAGATQAPMLAAAGAADGAAVGKGLLLTGRIDRVDVHPDRGIFRALDYKTSSNAESPTKTHRVVRGPNKGQWKDLQLPLYRVLLRSMPEPIAVDAGALGYINLAPSMEKSGFEFLEASDLDLDAAEAQASEIVARILAGDFTPSARIPVRPDDPLGPVWGLGFRVLDDDEARGGDETRGGDESRGGDDSRSGGGEA
jgi:ATP-dependent helicase/DNAse subunit B